MQGPPPNPGGAVAPEGKSWLAGTMDARQRALDAAAPDARSVAAIRFARAQTWAGDDAAAMRTLIAERRAQRRRGAVGEVARCELGLAEIALIGDDEDRAAVHLDAAAAAPLDEMPTRQILAGWIAARRGARVVPEAPKKIESPWILELADAVAIELLWLAVDAGDTPVRSGDVRTRALVEIVEAVAGREAIAVRHALRSLEKSGLARDHGRSILRVLGAAPTLLGDTAELTPWIARAQAGIGESATWRDRVALRHAWRLHGRRDADKALPREIALRIDARDRMRAHVHSTLTTGLDRQVRAVEVLEAAIGATSPESPVSAAVSEVREAIDLLDASTAGALSELGRVEGDLAQLVASTFAERERARAIASVIAALEGSDDVDVLLEQLVSAIADQLTASAVVIAERVPHVGLRAVVARGIDPADEEWIFLTENALDSPIGAMSNGGAEAGRRGGSDVPPGAPFLVTPMRAPGSEGAIYVDKKATGGTFTSSDGGTLDLLASYAGLAIARMRAKEASASMGRRLAATMDAMRDGLLAVDSEGVVTAINEPATRALRVDAGRILNHRLDAIPELAPLATALAAPERLDGAVVRLAQSSIVVHAREVRGEGVVVTLVEYERAQKIAQKLVGPRTRYTFADLRGNDPALRDAIEMGRRASSVDASVLIIGESGTGKEVLAQAIHAGGARAREPFVAINCAALPRELLEAELFGYERGAFTGARAEGSVGKFELAGDGTILLDEIVDMPIDMQAKLLRVLQERVVVRLGSSTERPVRARVMATAQRDLAIDVERGRFRLDLFHRLRVLQIALPALRNRGADIAVIARHYVRAFAERQGKSVRAIAAEVEGALIAYTWPGNVRELANVIEGEVSLLAPDARVLERVPPQIMRASEPPRDLTFASGEMLPLSLQAQFGMIPGASTPPPAVLTIVPLAEVERRAYIDAYEKSQRSVTRAAKALGVSKVTFYTKLKQFGMHPSDVTGEVPSLRSTSRIPLAEPYPDSTRIPLDEPPQSDPTPPPRSRR